MKMTYTLISFLLLSLHSFSQQASSDSIPQGTIIADIDGITTSFNFDCKALVYPTIIKGYHISGYLNVADTAKHPFIRIDYTKGLKDSFHYGTILYFPSKGNGYKDVTAKVTITSIK